MTLTPGSSYVDVTLFFDNVQRRVGINEMLSVGLVHSDTESGVRVDTMSTTIILEGPGKQ